MLQNRSPPAIFVRLNYIFESSLINYKAKKLFIKFVLYIVAEKLEGRILNRRYSTLLEVNSFTEDIGRKALAVQIDVNNGNKMTARGIMSFFGVTEDETIHYLQRNFLPKNWTKYPKELWDLYLN